MSAPDVKRQTLPDCPSWCVSDHSADADPGDGRMHAAVKGHFTRVEWFDGDDGPAGRWPAPLVDVRFTPGGAFLDGCALDRESARTLALELLAFADGVGRTWPGGVRSDAHLDGCGTLCPCGKTVSHLKAHPDSDAWACRVPLPS